MLNPIIFRQHLYLYFISTYARTTKASNQRQSMDITFWGARGSIPSPLSPAAIEQKIAHVLVEADGRKFRNEAEAKTFLNTLAPVDRGTAGGNTSCVEVTSGAD